MVNVMPIAVSAMPGSRFNSVKYSCPSCGNVLNVGVDPVALKSDIVSEILQALGKGKTA